MQSSVSINLLKGRVNLLDEALKWALTIGRLLVIIVEFVAFSTFIYRFSLDRTIIDLHDKINQEQAIVASLADREKVYRNLQERITVATKSSSQGDNNVKIINDIVGFTPPEISFNSISIANNQVNIDSNVRSISALNGFLNSLKNYKQIGSVSITNISNSASDSSVKVEISATLKGGGL